MRMDRTTAAVHARIFAIRICITSRVFWPENTVEVSRGHQALVQARIVGSIILASVNPFAMSDEEAKELRCITCRKGKMTATSEHDT
jgi:hypothetical protein